MAELPIALATRLDYVREDVTCAFLFHPRSLVQSLAGANIIQIGFTALTGYVTLYEAHTYHDRALDVPIESQKQLKNGKY